MKINACWCVCMIIRMWVKQFFFVSFFSSSLTSSIYPYYSLSFPFAMMMIILLKLNSRTRSDWRIDADSFEWWIFVCVARGNSYNIQMVTRQLFKLKQAPLFRRHFFLFRFKIQIHKSTKNCTICINSLFQLIFMRTFDDDLCVCVFFVE